jgi:hypothetical protein
MFYLRHKKEICMKKYLLILSLVLTFNFSPKANAGIGWMMGAAISASFGNSEGLGVHLVAGGMLTWAGIYSMIKAPGPYSYVLLILDEKSASTEIEKIFPFIESNDSVQCLADKLEMNVDSEKNYTALNAEEINECVSHLDLTIDEIKKLNSVLN